MCFSPQRRAIFRHCNFEKCSENLVFCTFSHENVLLATPACNFSTSQLQKVVRNCDVLYIFTCKCASRLSGVQFFNISTAKSAPNPSVFLAFSLQNVRLATAACNFSTSQLQKVLRTPEFFSIFTSKCASRHSGVQFFNISTSKSCPELMCFVHFRFKTRFSPQRRAIFDFSSDHMTPHPPL